MHLKNHEILKIRRFLNHTIQAGLDEVDTLDEKTVQAFKDWVQGVKGITGHDGSFPSNTGQIPLVILEFDDGGDEVLDQVQATATVRTQKPVVNTNPQETPEELQRLMDAVNRTASIQRPVLSEGVVEIKTDTGFAV